jgi:hypothetical protein
MTGEFPPPEQWQFKTRLLRCWTDLQAHRQLRHDGAIQDVMGISLGKFRQGGQGTIVSDAVTEAQALGPLAMPAPEPEGQPAKHALTPFWERVIAGNLQLCRLPSSKGA